MRPPDYPPFQHLSVLHLARLTVARAFETLAEAVSPGFRPSPTVEPVPRNNGNGLDLLQAVPLPFPSGLKMIEAGAVGSVELRPQMVFRPDQILLESPENWEVEEIYAGNKPQFVAPGSIPATVLSDPRARMKMTAVMPGQSLVIRLRNRAMCPQLPAGMVVGYSLGEPTL